MTFGEALQKMEAGAFVAREGWNGKNQFIYMTEGSIPTVRELRGRAKAAAHFYDMCIGPLLLDQNPKEAIVPVQPHIDMFTEQRTIVCGWLASQTDMTATDWYVRDYAQNHQEAEDGTQSN